MSFKKEIVLSVLSFALASASFAQRRSNGPQINSSDPPSWVSGQQYRAEVRQEAGPWGINLEMLSTLQLDSAQVSNVYVVAASQSNQETLRLNLNGRTLNSVTLNNHLQMIVFPVNRSLVRSFDKLELTAKGAVYISEIGLFATHVGDADHHDDPTPPINPFPGWPLPGFPVTPPDIDDPPAGNRQLMEFRGGYEQTDVSFEGQSRSEINSSCTDYMKRHSFSFVNSVKVFSTSASLVNLISSDAFCAWAALNSQPVEKKDGDDANSSYQTDVVISGLPFQIRLNASRDVAGLRRDIDALAPKIQLNFINEVKRDDQDFQLVGAGGSVAVKSILKANLPLIGQRLKADGKFSGFPFRFEGYAREDIRKACTDALSAETFNFVTEMTVNDQDVQSTHFMDKEEICMTISTDAN